MGTCTTGKVETAYIRMAKLKKRFPNAKIIIVIRERKSWVLSIYNQYVKEGGKYSFRKWWKKKFDIQFLDTVLMYYVTTIFDDVLILHMDDLKSGKFVKKLCDFIGVPVPKYRNIRYGKSLSPMSLLIIRIFNLFNIHLYKFYRLLKGTWR